MKICGKCGQKVNSDLNKCSNCGFKFKHENNNKNMEIGKKAVRGAIKTRSVVLQTIFFPVIAFIAYISVYITVLYGMEFFKNINKNKEAIANFIETVECQDEFDGDILCNAKYKYIVNDEEYIIYDEGVLKDNIEEKITVYYNEDYPYSASLSSSREIIILFFVALIFAIIFVRLFLTGIGRLLKLNDIFGKNK
jgi:uncharacterized membrane protein YvbJ